MLANVPVPRPRGNEDLSEFAEAGPTGRLCPATAEKIGSGENRLKLFGEVVRVGKASEFSASFDAREDLVKHFHAGQMARITVIREFGDRAQERCRSERGAIQPVLQPGNERLEGWTIRLGSAEDNRVANRLEPVASLFPDGSDAEHFERVEVLVERGLGGSDAFEDLVQADISVPVLAEQFYRCVNEELAFRQTFVLQELVVPHSK